MASHAVFRSVLLAIFILQKGLCPHSTYTKQLTSLARSQRCIYEDESAKPSCETQNFHFRTSSLSKLNFCILDDIINASVGSLECENNVLSFSFVCNNNYEQSLLSTYCYLTIKRIIKTKKWFKARMSYYDNSDATFNFPAMAIALSGDVHPQPGPDGSSLSIPTRISNRRRDDKLKSDVTTKRRYVNGYQNNSRYNSYNSRSVINIPTIIEQCPIVKNHLRISVLTPDRSKTNLRILFVTQCPLVRTFILLQKHG